MFAKAAEKITNKLLDNNSISCEQYEICRFGFQQGLTIMLNAATVIVIGIIMNELWQAILFMALYAPLRSNAGGYHARTAARCYVYSILLMIAVLLTMKYLYIPTFICVIIFVISCAIILVLAPVEDSNKRLEEIEQVVYKKRTIMITAIESFIFFVTELINAYNISTCITTVIIMMSGILIAGKIKTKLNQT